MIIKGPDGKDRNTRNMDAGRAVTFHNVTITICDAKNPADAYDLLCIALAAMETDEISVEWQTDTYSTDAHGENVQPTSDLFPPEGSERERKGRADDNTETPVPGDLLAPRCRHCGNRNCNCARKGRT